MKSSKRKRKWVYRKRRAKPLVNLEESVSHYIMASYLYYILDKPSPISDTQFDRLARKLLKDWDSIEHMHKHLLSKQALRAGTLFDLKVEDYPLIARHAAVTWAKEHGIDI